MVASRLVCGTAISKTPVRADIVTGTLMFMHVLAAAEPASRTTAKADLENIFALFLASRFSVCSILTAQSLRINTGCASDWERGTEREREMERASG